MTPFAAAVPSARRWLRASVTVVILLIPSAPGRADDTKLPSDLALVPTYGELFVSVRLADVLRGKLGHEIAVQLLQVGDRGTFVSDTRALGVAPTDVERVTFMPPFIMIVRTVRPYDRQQVLATLAPGAQARQLGGRTIYGNVYLADDRTYVINSYPPAYFKPAPAGAGALDEALQLAAGHHSIVVGVRPLPAIQSLSLNWSAQLHESANSRAPIISGGPPPGAGGLRRTLPVFRPSPPPGPGGIRPPGPPPSPFGRSLPPQPTQPIPPGPDPSSSEEQDQTAPTPPSAPSLQEILKRVPPEALPYQPLLYARLITLTADLGDPAQVQLQAVFPNADRAREGATSLKTGLYVIRHLLPRVIEEMDNPREFRLKFQALLGQIGTALKSANVTTQGANVSARLQFPIDAAAVASAVVHIRGQALRSTDVNNLKQIGLAFLNFHDTNGSFPPATIYSKVARPLLSWRVAILPFIGQENLYRQFRLNESWNSPHNKKLLAKMPAIYAPVGARPKDPYTTYYQVFTGPLAPFHTGFLGFDPRRPPFYSSGPSISTFADGLSNTVLVAESAHAVPWTKPEDMPYDEKKPLPKLSNQFSAGHQVLFADGAVRLLPASLDEQTLRYLIMPFDGNPIDWSKIDPSRASGPMPQFVPMRPPASPRVPGQK